MLPTVEKVKMLDILQTAPCSLAGQFVNSSNYTFFIALTTPDGDTQAVYKPIRGESPLWDFPTGSLAKREVAAYIVSDALGWHIVPPTVYRKKMLPYGAGSVQQFIDHDPNRHYFNLDSDEKECLKPVALFDCLINNADRKGSHVLEAKDGRVYCIDHGICFHKEDKLRTVIWDFAGQPITQDLIEDLKRLVTALTPDTPLFTELNQYLLKGEIKALITRANHLVKIGTFPEWDKTRRQFPWPPV